MVRLLRVEHCPWRHDYGLRYLGEDLPSDVAARVAALVPGAGAAALRTQSASCFAWLDELLASPRLGSGRELAACALVDAPDPDPGGPGL